MKRLESNVTSNSASDRINKLKNMILKRDTSCNIIDENKSLNRNTTRNLRIFQNNSKNINHDGLYKF